MTIADRAVLVTGANRGIGQALVEEALSRGARRVYGGLALYDDLSDRLALERHLAVNLFGTYGVTQAFLPLLTRSRGAIVNVLSATAFAALPLIPAYSISKAAAFSMSQSLRALLAGRGVRVHAVLSGPVDTEMSRELDVPKASPASVARAIFDGVEKGEEEIFPDPMSASMAQSWRRGAAKALERQYAALVAAEPVKS
jgi:short-subunit dehydrogenase